MIQSVELALHHQNSHIRMKLSPQHYKAVELLVIGVNAQVEAQRTLAGLSEQELNA